MKKLLVILFITLFAPVTYADQALPISYFWIIGNTSAIYNPTLPSPLTPLNMINGMDWDVASPGQLASSRVNGGGWIAFVTGTWGYYGYSPVATYSNAPVVYFGYVNVVDSSGSAYAFLDIYACACANGALAQANTTSINGQPWYTRLFIQ